jgi:hypothetical protein
MGRSTQQRFYLAERPVILEQYSGTTRIEDEEVHCVHETEVREASR